MGGSSSRPAPPPPAEPAKLPPPTEYIQIPRWAVDDYNAALAAYNRPYVPAVIARNTSGSKWELVLKAPAEYNPPLPPWVADKTVDMNFMYEIGAYRNVLKNVQALVKSTNESFEKYLQSHHKEVAESRANTLSDYLRNPPTPRPPPESMINNLPRPAAASTGGAAVTASAKNDISALKVLYAQMFNDGKKLLERVRDTQYIEFIPNDPPKDGDSPRRIDEKFFQLRNAIRERYTAKTGNDAPVLPFPYSVLSREGFLGRPAAPAPQSRVQTREHFADAASPIQFNGKWYKCAPLTDYQLWATRSLNEKYALCSAYGYTYIQGISTDACPCFAETAAPVAPPPPAPRAPTAQLSPPPPPIDTGARDTTLAPEPETAAKYVYDLSGSKFAPRTYTIPQFNGMDGPKYRAYITSKSAFTLADIADYYDALHTYNHYWYYQYGWKASADTATPYNPPQPIWHSSTPPSAEATAYKTALATFNDKARQLLTRFKAADAAVQLPANFGELPADPPYPNSLHEALLNPAKFARADQMSSLPSLGASASSATPTQITFEIPVDQVGQVYRHIEETPPPTEAASASKPSCGTGLCAKYKESPPMVRQFLEERERQRKVQQSLNDKVHGYTMGAPRASSGSSMEATLTAQYQRIKPSLIRDVKSMLGAEGILQLGK